MRKPRSHARETRQANTDSLEADHSSYTIRTLLTSGFFKARIRYQGVTEYSSLHQPKTLRSSTFHLPGQEDEVDGVVSILNYDTEMQR